MSLNLRKYVVASLLSCKTLTGFLVTSLLLITGLYPYVASLCYGNKDHGIQ